METFWRDVRFGARALVRSPGFAIVAIATLALGIGANSAIFRVLDIVVLNPLPWEDPEHIVNVWEVRVLQDSTRGVATAKYPEWREQARSFEDLAAARWGNFNLTDGDRPDAVEGARVAPSIFAVLGVRPSLGRPFLEEEAEPGAPKVAILSHGLWERRFGRDPDIVGRSLGIDGEPVTIVGVIPEATYLPWPQTELVTPLRMGPEDLSRTDHALNVFGRLAPGVSISRAQRELDLIAARLAEHYPETDAEWRARVQYTRDTYIDKDTQNAAILVMGAVVMVLLIACANVANLQLARGAARQKEIAIRSAIGASRVQITLQLLTESALLALLALPLSLLVSHLSFDGILSLMPPDAAWLEAFFRVDPPLLLIAAGIASLTALLFGLTPALKASKTDLTSDLKQGGERGSSGAGGQRLRSTLVVAQIAVSLGLIVGAGLLIKRSIRMQSVDAGFPTENLLTTYLELPRERYPEPDHWKSFQRELLTRLEGLPGVRSASTAASAPFGGPYDARDFTIRGKSFGPDDEIPRALWSNVSTGYFETLGLRLLQGRTFLESDRGNSVPVVVINDSLARRFFENESPLGQYLVYSDGTEREILGVVSDVSEFRAFAFTDLHLYEPYMQRPSANLAVLVRTQGPPLSLGSALRREVRASDPLLPLFSLQSMTRRIEISLWFPRALTNIMATLAGVALALTIVGVYGVVSYATSRRTGEFGIRAALGAEPSAIAGLVLRQAALLAGWGVAIGLFLALAVTQLLAALVYDMEAFDPVAFLMLSLLLVAVALAASAIPALRATRADPMIALHAE